MNWWLLFGIIAGSIVVLGIGAGGAYWLYVRSRTKKITFPAKIWEASGEMSDLVDDDGNKLDVLQLNVLKPFGKDTIIREDLGHMLTTYRLAAINRPVPEVKAEHITYWGKDKREVNVLKDGDNFTLLRVGFDKKGSLVFQPMPYDLSNMILNQYALKEEKFKKEKDVMAAITPWIVAGVLMLGMVMGMYFLGQGWIGASENMKSVTEMQTEAATEISQRLVDVAQASQIVVKDNMDKLGIQPE